MSSYLESLSNTPSPTESKDFPVAADILVSKEVSKNRKGTASMVDFYKEGHLKRSTEENTCDII